RPRAPERPETLLAVLVVTLVQRLGDPVAVEQQRVSGRERLLARRVLGVLLDPERKPAVAELEHRPVPTPQQRVVVPGIGVEQPAALQVDLTVEERDELAGSGR